MIPIEVDKRQDENQTTCMIPIEVDKRQDENQTTCMIPVQAKVRHRRESNRKYDSHSIEKMS